MRLRVTRVVAIWLVLLGISPFTAPFSTCDLSIPVGPASDIHTDLWLKAAPDSDKAPVLAGLVALTAPVLDLLTELPAAPRGSTRPPRTFIQVLRI